MAQSTLRLLYVTSEDWYFLSHRLPMARAAREAGFEVHVATRVVNGGEAISAEGFVLHPIPFSRGRIAPLSSARTIYALQRLDRLIRPTVIHHISLQASILGSLAILFRSVRRVNAMTGFGFVFTSQRPLARMLRPFAAGMLRFLCNRRDSIVLVQNPHDRDTLIALRFEPARIRLIPGSGVDTDLLQPQPEPDGPVTVGFVGRLLDDKGIRTLIESQRLLRAAGADIRLLIAGTPDPANPTSIPEAEALAWNQIPGVAWLGHVEDMAAFWKKVHIAVLPSRREGLPLSLLEAAACGRPMVATDVPGCREVAIPEETGILVPMDDALALAAAIRRLADSQATRIRYGTAARRLAVEKFSAVRIGQATAALYRQLAAPDIQAA